VIEAVDGGVEERVIQEMDRIGLTFQIFIKKKNRTSASLELVIILLRMIL